MSPVLATPATAKLNAPSLSNVSHQYGTRIRSNSVIRPSARLRQSPDPPPPRRIKPAPVAKAKATAIAPEPALVDMPVFPPPNIMLHSDDMNSRVFIAVGRALMSVGNCAMTIKDLADQAMKFGLACQNPSAAGQAITTYIRNHLQRCDAQEDHPLLLRHIMSGTPSDDELVTALHSRVGGAHCMINVAENRVTNFRRGTMVWYLSKAAGAPCPFARAGITLSDYGETGKVGETLNTSRERKRERDRLRRAEQCGQKRKRLARACADRGDSDADSSEDEQRAPKVKLTLRLKRSSTATGSESRSSSPAAFHIPNVIDLSQDESSESDAMSCSSSDSEDEEDADDGSQTNVSNHNPSSAAHASSAPPLGPSSNASRRSFSIPVSTLSGSPPPDSEDEDEDLHFGATGFHRAASVHSRNDSDFPLEDDEEFDSDFMSARDVDMETHWEESPGPRSPSVQFDEGRVVKSEPRDVQSLLDAWDDLDLAVTERKVVDVVAQAAAGAGTSSSQRKQSHMWTWDNFTGEDDHEFGYLWDHRLSPQVKLEMDSPLTLDSLPPFDPLPAAAESPLSPYSTYSAATSPRDFVPDEPASWEDVDVPSPDSAQSVEDDKWFSPSVKPSETVAPITSVSPSMVRRSNASGPSIPPQPQPLNGQDVPGRQPPPSPQLLLSPSSEMPPFPSSDLIRPTNNGFGETSMVHTLEPCVPAISATVYEGIPVYQTMLDSCLVLRRIDTDYVKVSHIQDVLRVDASASVHSDAVQISQGSPIACGTWLPAAIARKAIGDHWQVNTFLSEDLEKRFPPALGELRRNAPQDAHSHPFGRHFQSTVEAKRETFSFRIQLPTREPGMSWEAVEDHLLSVHPSYTITSSDAPATLPASSTEIQTPLSPTEEEIFHALCSVSDDWEASTGAGGTSSAEPPATCVPEQVVESTEKDCKEPACEHPLRRSKRTATTAAVKAIATRSRTRSNKRGSRSSLS